MPDPQPVPPPTAHVAHRPVVVVEDRLIALALQRPAGRRLVDVRVVPRGRTGHARARCEPLHQRHALYQPVSGSLIVEVLRAS